MYIMHYHNYDIFIEQSRYLHKCLGKPYDKSSTMCIEISMFQTLFILIVHVFTKNVIALQKFETY